MALVLVTGRDDALIETRKLLLENAGHSVFTATSEPEVINLCRQHDFDVAVIGQKVCANEKRRILGLVRQYCPLAKVLELFPDSSGRALVSADDWLPVPTDVPQELVGRVAALATRVAAKSKRGRGDSKARSLVRAIICAGLGSGRFAECIHFLPAFVLCMEA